MTSRRNIERIERIERDRLTLLALGVLAAGRTPYAQARAEFERRVAARSEPSPVPFDDLVQAMIAGKLIDYEAGPDGDTHPVALWLRPWGTARLRESGPLPQG